MTEHPLPDEWISMREAARRIGITATKVSRLAAQGRITTQQDPYDERVKLVNFAELRRIFPERKRQLES
jgi:DNA-binding MarR family transcriptional regulator